MDRCYFLVCRLKDLILCTMFLVVAILLNWEQCKAQAVSRLNIFCTSSYCTICRLSFALSTQNLLLFDVRCDEVRYQLRLECIPSIFRRSCIFEAQEQFKNKLGLKRRTSYEYWGPESTSSFQQLASTFEKHVLLTRDCSMTTTRWNHHFSTIYRRHHTLNHEKRIEQALI